MSKKIAYFPPDYDFSTLHQIEASTGIRFCDEGSELRDQYEAAFTADPASLNPSADMSTLVDGWFVPNVAPILQMVPEVLEKIANRLDAQSFLNLACSCTQLHNFYSRPTARSHINIHLKEETLTLTREGWNRRLIVTYKSELVPIPMETADENFDKCVQMVRKWPFSVHFASVSFGEDCDRSDGLDAMWTLERLEAVSIGKLRSISELPYDDIIALVDTYRVREVDLMRSHSTYTDAEWSALAQKPLDALSVDEFPLLLLHLASIPTIRIDFDDMDQDELKSIIQKWLVADGLLQWNVASLMNLSSFIAAFSEFCFLSFDFMGALPAQRPWLFLTGHETRDGEGLVMFIFREDGKLVKITMSLGNSVKLAFCPIADGPPVLSLQ